MKYIIFIFVLCLIPVPFSFATDKENPSGQLSEESIRALNAFFSRKNSSEEAKSQYELGLKYYFGYGVPVNYTEAEKWIKKAAIQGDAEAQCHLGFMYHNGQGVTQNYNEAVVWFKKAAELGEITAMTNLGVMYENGQGVTKDYREALFWYNKAANLGEKNAMNNLGLMYNSGEGVAQDYKIAFAWFKKAAELGHSRAMYDLGLMYNNGEGVTQDYREALFWYNKAANLGHSDAMNNLGLMYDNGQGVTQDYKIAIAWYKKAAELGNNTAKHNLSLMQQNTQSSSVNTSRKSDAQDNAEALGELIGWALKYYGTESRNNNERPQNTSSGISNEEYNKCYNNAVKNRIVRCYVSLDVNGYPDHEYNADCSGGTRGGRYDCEGAVIFHAYSQGTGNFYCDSKNNDNLDKDINVVIDNICNN